MSKYLSRKAACTSDIGFDLYSLIESDLMRQSTADIFSGQEDTLETYTDSVLRMYLDALLNMAPSPSPELLQVHNNFQAAHLAFVDIVDPHRFESSLSVTVEGEFCLTRPASIGGQVTLLFDDDLITFSYLPAQLDSSKEQLKFYDVIGLQELDYKKLLYRFFEL